MKSNIEKVLIIILVLIICLITIVISLYVIKQTKYDKEMNPVFNEIQGEWIMDSTQFYKDGLIVAYDEKMEDEYINFHNRKIDICNKDNKCKSYKYELNDNSINIQENDLYLSGTNEYYLENGQLIFKKKLDGDNRYIQIIFKRK